MIKAYAASEPGGKLREFEYEPGQLGALEVEINVNYCGICHSDISMIDNAWDISVYPLVPGHEVIGTIAALGEHVSGLHEDQVVGLGWHAGYCGECTPCKNGDQNLCSNAAGTIVSRHGGFADKVRAQANSVVPLPHGIDLTSAGPMLCGGITVFNPLVQFDVKPTDRVAVIGIGGLGHIALQFLSAWGCEVTAFTTSESKRQDALAMGAHHTLNSRDTHEIEAAAGRFDMILSTVNVKLDWNLYLTTLKPRGRLHFVGATLDPLDINVFPLIMGQLSVSGTPTGSPATMSKMFDFALRHNIKPVIESFRFDQVNEAIAHLRSGKARYRTVLAR
ncbi:MAG: NAD(P)-dependent alcohol dehydrogenase [Gammaproteobacteria bacterium]|nr:NAD(P)-dependent alcohol dehydrogenase [Gammaproteobacteria bacterium]